jgi:hypothetical protein
MALGARAGSSPARPAVWVGAVAICALSTGFYAGPFFRPVEVDLAILLAVAATAATLLTGRRAHVAIMVAVATVAGVTALAWSWGHIDIDVYQSLDNAAAALLHGHNPYAATSQTLVPTGPGQYTYQSINFQYGPGAALLAVPGKLLGDVRLMSVLAFVVLAASAREIARAAGARGGRLVRVSALCLAIPLTAGMLRYAWVDVYMMAGFGAWLALRRHHPWAGVACLALSVSIKPVILVALIPGIIWSRRCRVELLAAAGLAALLLAPFAILTGPVDLYRDIIGIQVSLGPRYDALTLNSLLFSHTGHMLPGIASLLIAGGVTLAVLRRRAREHADVMGAAALILTVSFLVAKWAFFNYYFVSVWLLVLGLAGGAEAFDTAAVGGLFVWHRSGLAVRRLVRRSAAG